MKIAQRLLVVLIVATLAGCVGAVGFEIALEFDRFDHIPRDYKTGLWVSDISFLVGAILAALCGHLAWKTPEVFRDLIVIDFFDWVRGLFKSP